LDHILDAGADQTEVGGSREMAKLRTTSHMRAAGALTGAAP
jgi:hypothetical protein